MGAGGILRVVPTSSAIFQPSSNHHHQTKQPLFPHRGFDSHAFSRLKKYSGERRKYLADVKLCILHHKPIFLSKLSLVSKVDSIVLCFGMKVKIIDRDWHTRFLRVEIFKFTNHSLNI